MGKNAGLTAGHAFDGVSRGLLCEEGRTPFALGTPSMLRNFVAKETKGDERKKKERTREGSPANCTLAVYVFVVHFVVLLHVRKGLFQRCGGKPRDWNFVLDDLIKLIWCRTDLLF